MPGHPSGLTDYSRPETFPALFADVSSDAIAPAEHPLLTTVTAIGDTAGALYLSRGIAGRLFNRSSVPTLLETGAASTKATAQAVTPLLTEAEHKAPVSSYALTPNPRVPPRGITERKMLSEDVAPDAKVVSAIAGAKLVSPMSAHTQSAHLWIPPRGISGSIKLSLDVTLITQAGQTLADAQLVSHRQTANSRIQPRRLQARSCFGMMLP